MTTSISDEDIASLNVAYFVNFSDTSKILPTGIEDGTDVTSIVTQTGQSLTFSCQAGLQYNTFGSMFGMKYTANWNSCSANGCDATEDGSTLFINFKTMANTSTGRWLFKSDKFNIMFICKCTQIWFSIQ